MDEYVEEEKKKFVITRGMLILGILVLIIIIIVIFLVIKSFKKEDKITLSDFKKLENRMIEEAPIYVYQKNIELNENETKIDLKELLEDNGGTINSNKIIAAKKCDGYVIATKTDNENYKAYIKCGDLYTTSGYVGNNKETTSKSTTTKKDTVKPVITIVGEKELNISVGDSYTDPGAKASDNIDGDITSKIKTSGSVDTSKAGTYKITYVVTDKAGNKTEIFRTVTVNVKTTSTTTKPITSTTKKQTTTVKTTTKKVTTSTKKVSPPVITLYGEKTINLNVGDRYLDPGYIAYDYNGRNITSSVNVSGNVNTLQAGTYVITYKVSDSYGNIATTTRTIIVKSNNISVNSISITPNSLELSVGESKRLIVSISPSNATNKSITWSSSNNSVATVSADGTVTGRKKGTTLITAKSSNGKTSVSRVYVK